MLLVNHCALSGLKKLRSGNFDARNEEHGTWNVIYYELLKPGETVNTERYRQQMIDLNQALREKRPEYQKKATQSNFASW